MDCNYQCLNMGCLPDTFCAKALCPAYEENGNVYVFALAHKDFKTPYLLKYQLIDTEQA